MNATVHMTGEIPGVIYVDYFPENDRNGGEFFAVRINSHLGNCDLLMNRHYVEQLYAKCGHALQDNALSRAPLPDRDNTQPAECVAPYTNPDGTLYIEE